jgi:hypothetical protein
MQCFENGTTTMARVHFMKNNFVDSEVHIFVTFIRMHNS